MRQNSNILEILNKLKAYKRKYYLNKIVKGLIFTIGLFLLILLFSSWLEYTLQMGKQARTITFIVSSVGILYFLINYICIPAYRLLQNGKQLSDHLAAKQIGEYFPEVQDKLLNIIQLGSLTSEENSLISASIEQKYHNISFINFTESINIRRSNASYLPYLLIPASITLLTLMYSPNMITEGSYRILKFNKEFVPKAPFSFVIENKKLEGFKGENFTLKVKLEGKALPQQLFLSKNGLKQTFEQKGANHYQFTIKNPQKDVNFNLEAAGYKSMPYTLSVIEKPTIQDMSITLDYPSYIATRKERITNSGNLIIPEGTNVQWLIKSRSSDSISIVLKTDTIAFDQNNGGVFDLSKTILNSTNYQLHLHKLENSSQQTVNYGIEVIKDVYPAIKLAPINDSTYFRQIALAGEISDDYGFSSLSLYYKQYVDGEVVTQGNFPLAFDRKLLNQKYFQVWQVDSLLKKQNAKLEYHVQVADNDGINGPKYTKSQTYTFQLPNDEKISEQISKISESAEQNLNKNIESSKNSALKLDELEKILKTKRNLNWTDKKLLEEVIEEQLKRRQTLENIKDQLNQNQIKRDRFNKQNKSLKQKSEQLESLMEEMLRDENEELLEKIKSLLKDQNQSDDFRESVKELTKNEKNKLKEMERLMELFKRMEIQYDLNQVGQELQELEKQQDKLAEENKADSQNTSDPAKLDSDQKNDKDFETADDRQQALDKQEEINKEFDKIQEKLRDIEERNQSLKQPNPLQDTKENENTIDLTQQNSKQKIQENNKKEAGEEQKKSAEEMGKMSEMLSSMQMGMEMEMLQENIDDLKNIVDNLLKLSFRQEKLFNDFMEVNPSDPRFIALSKKQLAMQDDAKIVEDSLIALSERVFQIKNFINKELNKMNEAMASSIEALKVRENGRAVGEQQFAMTSINNLALMLDDVLQQMQMQMQSSMGMGKPSQGNQQTPSLSEMQKSLNQKTQQLNQGQKSGRQFSEQLGDLVQEQAKIRRLMQKLAEELGTEGQDGSHNGAGSPSSIIEEMEKIEEDLVNKRINRQLIQRQQRIVTKLLESEKAQEEQEQDEERKGETATEYDRTIMPDAFEKYIKAQQKQIEQLRNVPPNFTPFYKNEINKYYNRLKSKENLIP